MKLVLFEHLWWRSDMCVGNSRAVSAYVNGVRRSFFKSLVAAGWGDYMLLFDKNDLLLAGS